MREIREIMPNGRTMRGWTNGDDTELEIGTVAHAMPDGSTMYETVIRLVAPLEPVPGTEQDAQPNDE
ncbi:hypothetical protein JYK14_07200 [Siccirubricoccus sp. KC 17139]|uniref:Uncharacterized protein n=1 Tax=Siccirubricoccus soli TaxID=2899147 RepID=A0ABT1D239_9PROT|nr:hypothetical protein [Siccirubricoccus soli]MCO6415963.1 hypothetical protein [Siccirubricoccus soli]MCP2682095.1 hypothetical protein [Siccirubricoccus soli]